MNKIEIKKYSSFNKEEILALYNDAGWTNYTNNPTILLAAFKNSLYIAGAYQNSKLLGLIRIVGDGVTIIYIQDLLVLKAYQRLKIGTKLMEYALNKYSNIRQKVLLTDNTPAAAKFYQSLGFKDSKRLNFLCFYHSK